MKFIGYLLELLKGNPLNSKKILCQQLGHTLKKRNFLLEQNSHKYAKYGYPNWLKKPAFGGSIEFILNKGETYDEPEGLKIVGECPISEKALCDKIKKEINEALSEVSYLKVRITCLCGVGN